MIQHLKTGTLLILILLGFVLTLLLIGRLAPLVLLVLIAVVLTTGIDPVVTRLQQVKIRGVGIPRTLATLLVLLVGILVILGVVTFLAVTATREAINFAQNIWPRLQEQIVTWFTALSNRYTFIPDSAEIYQRISAQSSQIAAYLWSTTRAVFGFIGGLFSLVTVFILTIFFTIFKDGITYTFRLFIPPRHQARAAEVAHSAASKMGGWLRGQLLLAFIITGLTVIGMWALGVPYAFLIAIIGGLGELIPMVGPYVAFFPAIAIVLAIGGPLWQIIAVVVFFAVLSQVENYILYPKVMERHVELSPVTTILALFTGGGLLGIVGALLAVPVVAAGRVVMLEVVFPLIQGKTHEQIEADSPENRDTREKPAPKKAKASSKRKKKAPPPEEPKAEG